MEEQNQSNLDSESSESVNAETESQDALPSASDLSVEQQRALVYALVFASGEPLSVERICEITKLSREETDAHLAEIAQCAQQEASGVELVRVGERYHLRTKAEFGAYLQELKAGRPRRLSAAALETLAVIAYRQPVVKSDIEKIRGVDVAPTLKTLMDRDLIKIIGHQATVGQPALYGTSDEFLRIFGISSLTDLPTLRELTEISSEPGESGEEVLEQPEELVAEEGAAPIAQ